MVTVSVPNRFLIVNRGGARVIVRYGMRISGYDGDGGGNYILDCVCDVGFLVFNSVSLIDIFFVVLELTCYIVILLLLSIATAPMYSSVSNSYPVEMGLWLMSNF